MSGTEDNVKATKEATDPLRNTRTRRRPANGRVSGINSASLTNQVKDMQSGKKKPGLIDRIKESPLLNRKPEVPQEEQDHLKNEFLVYVNTKETLITNPEQLQDFNKQVEKFLKRMDGREHDHWGSDRYFRLLEKWFPDYEKVISGKVNSIKESIGVQVNSLNERIVEITTKTKEAMQLASTDTSKARELLKQTNDKLTDAREKTKAATITLNEFGTKEQQAQFAASYSQIISNYGALISAVESSIEGMGQDITRYQSLIPQLDSQAGKLKDFNNKVQKEQDVQALIQIQQDEFALLNKDIQSFIEGINLSRGTEAVDGEKVDQEIKKESESLSGLDEQVAEAKAKEIARRQEEKRRKAEEERKRKEAEAERIRKEQEAANQVEDKEAWQQVGQQLTYPTDNSNALQINEELKRKADYFRGPRDEYERAILNEKIYFTSVYGWIDHTHAFTDTQRNEFYIGVEELWRQLKSEPSPDQIYRGYYSVNYRQDVIPEIPILGKEITIGIERQYLVKPGLNIDERKSIALAIFQDVSFAFEQLQAIHPTSGSSFEPADLPSNMINFYRIVEDLDPQEIKEAIQVLSPEKSLEIYRMYSGTFTKEKYKNREFEPQSFDTPYTSENFGTPEILNTIKPAKVSPPSEFGKANLILLEQDIIRSRKRK